jgi:hypothetical protein
VQLDQVLGLSTRAIETVIEPFGRTVIEIGDDEADVEAEPRRLDTSNGAPFAIPGFGSMPRLGVTPHDIFVGECAFRANGVRCLVDLSRQRLRAGKAEDIVDAVRLTPRHRLGPRVMPVAPEQDAGSRPALSNMPHQPAQMSAHLDAGRVLPGRRMTATGRLLSVL